jgi:DNA-binding SARP family transcriptional activator
MSDLLEISTFGGLSIQRNGETVEGFASRKADALLVYLACTDRPHSREVLADLLWDDRSQARALSNLRVVLASIRKLLGPFVSISRDSVALNPESEIWLDVAHLDSTLATVQAQAGRISSALASEIGETVSRCKGDFLEGFHVRDCRGFENWVVLERERLHTVLEQNLQLLVDALVANERWMDAIDWAERWIALGQCPEPAFRALMRAYGGLGDMANVAATYQRCVELMARELGLEPSHQTRETYEWLASGRRPETAPVQAVELEPPSADNAARLLLNRWRDRDAEVLDVASLAVVYASRGELGIGSEQASLLIRSALHHGVDVKPWLKRVGSPQAAVQALEESLERYPRPFVRMQIVDALKGLSGNEAADALLHVGTSDDSSEVRAEAAVAAAQRGRLDQVVAGLLDDLEGPGSATAMAALVAVADECGLPEDVGEYPRIPVSMGVAQRRWQARRGDVFRQMRWAGLGVAVAMAFHGILTPLFTALAFPEEFQEIIGNLVTLATWIIGSSIVGFVIGGLLGMASGFAVGLADAMWRGKQRVRWRLLMGCLAGLVHSAYLIAFTLSDMYQVRVGAGVYIPVYLAFGLLQGLITAWVIPQLGTSVPIRKQLGRSVGAGVATALLAVPYVYLVYADKAGVSLLSRLVYSFLIPFGLGLALGDRKAGRAVQAKREHDPEPESDST